MTLPATGLCPLDRHGQNGPRADASVGDGSSGDRRDPERSLSDPSEPFSGGSQRWDGPTPGQEIRTGDPLLTGAA